MNDDLLNLSTTALLTALPSITTLVDREARVIQQFNAEGTPLLTAAGEVFLSGSTPEFSELLRAAAQTAKPAHFETQFTLSPSESRWYEHEVVTVSKGPAIVLSRDSTAQKTRDAEFVSIKRRYDAIVQNVSDAISISTWGTSYDDNVLLEVNQRTLDLLGYSLDELRSMQPSDVLAEEHYKSQAYRNRMLRETGQIKDTVMQFPIRRKDGSIRFVESLPVLIKDDDDQIIEAMAMVRDVTERVEREEQLRQAMLAAEAALTARDVFVANMSEELRQPLRDIVEHTRRLLGCVGISSDTCERLNRIHDQADHLDRQIGDILDLSRVEAGFDAVELSVFNLPHLLRRLEETLRLKAQQCEIALHFESADDLPILIQTDETKLKQILVNVIGDALKVTARGSVSVRVLCTPDHVLRFEIADTRNRADEESSPYHSVSIA
ncbi:MAG: PAS domain S-box protein, partial [Anaerolineae bacterium]|nr:PAS domain S-box protein [Anaerolineae bacterium]